MSRVFGLMLCSLIAFPLAAADSLPMPLEASDPQVPIEVIADQTWSGEDVQATRKQWSKLALPPITYEAAKGPLHLVVDYAALRLGDQRGTALMDVGIECPEAMQPCAIPMTSSVIAIDSDYMGEHVATIAGQPIAVWVGRQGHRYSFPDGTRVDVWLSLLERNQLDPKAIRARLVYGQISAEALPGQVTRFGTLLKFASAIFVVAVIVLWWLRR